MAKTNTNARTLPGANMEQSSSKIRSILQSLTSMLGKYSVDKVKGLMESIEKLMEGDDGESIGEQLTNAINNKVNIDDYATIDKYGIVKLQSNGGVWLNSKNSLGVKIKENYGIKLSGDGAVIIDGATANDVSAGTSVYKAITPKTLKAVTDNISTNMTSVSDRVSSLETKSDTIDEAVAKSKTYYGMKNATLSDILTRINTISSNQIWAVNGGTKYSKDGSNVTVLVTRLSPILINMEQDESSMTVLGYSDDGVSRSYKVKYDFKKDVTYLIAEGENGWEVVAKWHDNESGNHWSSGTEIKHIGNAVDYKYEGSIGDMYLNIETLGVYRCGGRRDSGLYEWLYVGSWTKNSTIGYDNLDSSLQKMINAALENNGSGSSSSGIPDSVNDNITELQDDVKILGLTSNLPYVKNIRASFQREPSVGGVEVDGDLDITIPDDITPLNLDDESVVLLSSEANDISTQASSIPALLIQINSFKIHGVPNIGTNGTCGTLSVPYLYSSVSAPTSSGTFAVGKYYKITDVITYNISSRTASHKISADVIDTNSDPTIATEGSFEINHSQIKFTMILGWCKLTEKSGVNIWSGKCLNQTYYIFNKINYYDTVPVQIGTWIDGKPVWRLAFNYTFTEVDKDDIKSNGDFALSTLFSDKLKISSDAIIINYSASLAMNTSSPCYVDDIILSPADEVGSYLKVSTSMWGSSPYADNVGIYGFVDFVTSKDNIKD